MTFATFTNVALMLLCVAVLVQCARMMRSFNAIKSGDLAQTVKSLDNATAQARTVLAELKDLLATDGAANARAIASGEALRDELSMMIGIGNSVAERIMEASASANERSRGAEEDGEEDILADDDAEAGDVVTSAVPQGRSRRKRGGRGRRGDAPAPQPSDHSETAALVAMAVAEAEAATPRAEAA